MKFTTVTLGYEEIEWIRPGDELKDAIWDDSEWSEWIARRDLMEALEIVSKMHRSVANQMAKRGISSVVSLWSGRAMALVVQLKKRRQELRMHARIEFGDQAVLDAIRSFDRRHPKAEFTGIRTSIHSDPTKEAK